MPDLTAGTGATPSAKTSWAAPGRDVRDRRLVRWTDVTSARSGTARPGGRGLSTAATARSTSSSGTRTSSRPRSRVGDALPVTSRYSGRLWGGSRRLRLENTRQWYLPHIRIVQPTAVYLDAGSKDIESVHEDALGARLLRSRGVPVTVRTLAGWGTPSPTGGRASGGRGPGCRPGSRPGPRRRLRRRRAAPRATGRGPRVRRRSRCPCRRRPRRPGSRRPRCARRPPSRARGTRGRPRP